MKKQPTVDSKDKHAGEAEDPHLSRERYRVFIEDVADGFYETDLKGNFKYFNNALCRIFGYARDEIRDRNFREFMDAENAASTFRHFNQIYRSGEGITDMIWEIIRKDGQTRIIELSANLITDDRSNKVGFRGIARDITEKYKAQLKVIESEQLASCQYEASRRAEQRYRAFLNFLPIPVFVFNLDSTVSYLNPAFEETFGWTFRELEGRRIPFIPDGSRDQTRQGVKELFENKVLHGFETKRLTRDGRLLDIIIDGAVFYDEDHQPAGQVITLRDVTAEKRMARANEALFRISKALYQFRSLDDRLEFITREIQDLLTTEAALVILIDEEKNEFFFRAAAYEDAEAQQRYRETRFPLDKGVAGNVYRTGKPMMVHDYYNSPYFYHRVDEQTGFRTRDMVQVPMWTEDRMIGILCAVNKKDGLFDNADVDLLSTFAGIVALPIENARINEALKNSYEEVKSLNRAKDQVIHRLSHELKTPISVLSASLELISKKLSELEISDLERVIERSQRNLQRLLDMQYETEDILRERDFSSQQLLSILLDACSDQLESLVLEETGDHSLTERIRRRIDMLFGPREAVSEKIFLQPFVKSFLERIRPRFEHREVAFEIRLEPTGAVWVPPDVLEKIIEGLIRNAFENTPDGSRIEVTVRNSVDGPLFEVVDFGVGITPENQRLIFENYFTMSDSMQYSTRRPYDFNAGGRGFDLLRIKIFSERYHFGLRWKSERCRHLPGEDDPAPGRVDACKYCRERSDCLTSGGTTVTVVFQPAEEHMPSASPSADGDDLE
jgi:PAS domain S-box-containing protein